MLDFGPLSSSSREPIQTAGIVTWQDVLLSSLSLCLQFFSPSSFILQGVYNCQSSDFFFFSFLFYLLFRWARACSSWKYALLFVSLLMLLKWSRVTFFHYLFFCLPRQWKYNQVTSIFLVDFSWSKDLFLEILFFTTTLITNWFHRSL